MGAIVGAAYAAGISGHDLRLHLFKTLRRRQFVLARLLEARVGRFADILRRGLVNPVMVDAELILGLFWPPDMPETFEALAIPLLVVVTDFFAHEELVLSTGALRSAVAGSMAIPGLVRPVSREGRILVDGGAVNPLPYDLLDGPGCHRRGLRRGGRPGLRRQRRAEPVRGDVRLRPDHARRHHDQDAAGSKPPTS